MIEKNDMTYVALRENLIWQTVHVRRATVTRTQNLQFNGAQRIAFKSF